MRRFSVMILMALFAIPSFAEGRVGARYSNYATSLSLVGFSIDTDRESSLGVLGQFESGPIIIKGQYDHDFEAGLTFFSFLDLATLQRDRAEGSIGWRLNDFLTLEGAARYDSITAGSGFFGNDEYTLDGGQVGFGATVQSEPDASFNWYLTGRYYFGSVDVNDIAGTGLNGSLDTTGLRIEAGIPIRVSNSRWVVVPGFEYERYETESSLIDIEGNRVFVALEYAF